MMNALTIATAQNRITPDVRANGQQIRQLMQTAHEAEARLIHFPEGALSGYSKAQIQDWNDVDWSSVADELSAIATLARELKLWTVVGCNHRLSVPNRPHNSLYVISDQGELHTRYDKRRCSHSEISDWYTPGMEPTVFVIDGLRFGCALCIEVQFPDLWREYEQADVDCMLFSSYAENPMFGIQAQGHAACNNFWVSFAASTNVSQACPSHLIGPSGEIVQMAPADQATVIVNQLNPADPQWKVPLHYARPWRSKAREGEIYRAQQRVDDPRSLNKSQF